MSEDIQSGESGVVMKTVKEACAEGLVLTGGGREGIFIKEVKPDSPASKHLSMKEGDQILSATVYFDNVSYEDALQILEHAQPYKMEICLKRKVDSTMPEDADIVHPEGNVESSPEMRTQRKMKKQQDRISWPKFPSFGRGRRAQFKRSHSTSEAEEHRKLEMSPPTSDTESPFKSPLKFPDEKEQKKKQKMQSSGKTKGYRSKSVEEPQRKGKELITENMAVCENLQVDSVEEKLPEEVTAKLEDTAHVAEETESEISSKIKQDHALSSLSEMEQQHKVHYISLGNTLKTTDISVTFAEGSAGIMRTLEEGKVERSEMKVNIHQKEKTDAGIGNQSGENIISDICASDNDGVSPVVISQAESERFQLNPDLNTQVVIKGSSEEDLVSINTKMTTPKLDDSLELFSVGELKKPQTTGGEKELKERNVFENESYGIRIRGPLADMATTKPHFASAMDGFQFLLPECSDKKQESAITDTQEASFVIPDISQAKSKTDTSVSALDMKDLEIKKFMLPTVTYTDHLIADVDKKSESKFKLPNVDFSKFATQDPIKMTKQEQMKTSLPKREDIEIPGIEAKPCLQAPVIKVPKIEKITNITKEVKIQAHQTDEQFSVEDVKVAVSKFPAFKLPEGDVTGVLVQREVTIMEMKGDKSNITPRGSPRKISVTSADSSTTLTKSQMGKEKSSASDIADKDLGTKIPNVELHYDPEQISVAIKKLDYTKPNISKPNTDTMLITDDEKMSEVTFKLPKREDIEIPGMEAIKKSNIQKTKIKADKDIQPGEKTKTKKYGNQKGQEKKSKKAKITMPSFGITKPDIRFPDIGTDFPKTEVHKNDAGEIKIKKFEVDVPQTDTSLKDVYLPEDKDLKLHTIENIRSKSYTKYEKKEADIPIHEQFGIGKSLPDKKGPDLAKEVQLYNVDEKTQSTEMAGQGSKFKLPKFEISFPEVKVPKMHFSPSKKDTEISITDMPATYAAEVEMPDAKANIKEDVPEEDCKDHEMKTKRSSFSFPKFGFSKSDTKITEADVTLKNAEGSLPERNVDVEVENTEITPSMGDKKQEDETKFGSPTKFKIPSISLPKFGAKTSKVAVDVSGVESQVPAPETGLKQAEVTVSDEPLSLNIKGPDDDKKGKFHKDIQIDGQESKFRLPKFDISFREVKGPQINLHAGKTEADISAQEGKEEVHESDVEVSCLKTEVKSEKPKVDSKCQDAEIKKPVFSFPRFSFSKSETRDAESDVSLPQVDVSLPEEDVKIEKQDANIKLAMGYTGEEDTRKVGSSTKYKLPTISLPKFGTKAPKAAVEISEAEVQMKGPEINLPQTEVLVSSQPLSVDVKTPEVGKESKSVNVDINAEDIKIEGQESKIKMPKFAISFSEVKGPKIDLNGCQTTEISLPEGKGELNAPDVEGPDVKTEVKLDLPKGETQGVQVEMKKSGFSLPKIGLSRSETKTTEADVSLPQVDVSLQGQDVKIEGPDVEIKSAMHDTKEEDKMKVGSATKFKLPTISLPKFGAKAPKVEVDISRDDAQIKAPEISLPQTEVAVSSEPMSLSIKTPDIDKEVKSVTADIKAEDMKIEGQESKFKMPKFGISFPEVKGPKIDLYGSKTMTDISLPEGKAEVHVPDVEMPDVKTEVKLDLPKGETQGVQVEMKKSGFSLPKIGLSKSESKAPDTDVSLPQVDVSLQGQDEQIEGPDADIKLTMCDSGEEDKIKVGSATKFKLPTISLPRFGAKAPNVSVDISGEDAQMKGSEISLPQSEVVVSTEPLLLNIKKPDIDKDAKSLNVDIKAEDMKIEGQESKFKMPKFGISFPEVKGPKIDLHGSKTTDISLPEGKGKVHVPDVEMSDVKTELNLHLPKGDSKGLKVEMKKPGGSLPTVGFSKSTEASDAELSLPQVDVSLPGQDVKIEGPESSIKLAMCFTEEDNKMKPGSTTKFTLPTISHPKIGGKAPKAEVDIFGDDVQMKGPEISLPQKEVAVSSEPMSLYIKTPDIDKEVKSPTADIKAEDMKIEGQESKFKMPKFGISFPDVKGPKIDLHGSKTMTDISLPEGKGEVHVPDVEMPDVKTEVKLDLPKGETQGVQVEMKKSGFSLPKIGLSISESKGPDTDVSLPQVDVSLPRQDVKVEGPDANVNLAMGDIGEQDKLKFGSPTKFKLPTISLPKFGSKAKKESVDMSGVDVQIKAPEISLPQTEVAVSSEPMPLNIKTPDIDKEVKSVTADIKAEDMKIEGQESKFKIPKFGISFPEVKGPRIDLHGSKTTTDISLPEGKGEVHVPDVEMPDVKTEVKLDLPKGETQGVQVEMKKSGFSSPKIGLSKSETKAPDTDVSLPQVDVSLPGQDVKVEGPDANVNLAMGDIGEQDKLKFGSPTKFKLPTISLPKFGSKAKKESVDISGVDVQIKAPEISLPQTEVAVSSEPMSLNIKTPDIDKEVKSVTADIKAEDMKIEGQESKFKMPKFGISFPEVKGPKIDLHGSKTTTDISLPEGKGEVHVPDVEMPDVKTEVKLDLPKGETQGVQVEMKKSGFSLPKIGLSKSETKAPDTDVSLPQVDVSLPGQDVKVEGPDVEVNLAMGDIGEQDKLKFGSPTKFKLPTISFPKFGSKAKKESVDISGVDVQIKAPEISLPQTEVAVSSEPMSLNIKTSDIDKEVKSVTADIKAEDMKIDGQESKFKMPKFGISFPDVKGPKIDLHGSKTTTDISLPEGKGEVHVPDVEMPDVKTEVKLDLPKGETQGVQVEIKKSGFSLPKIGLSKSETKAPDTDVSLPQVDVSLQGQDVKVEGPDANVNLAMGDIGEQDKLKFGSPTKFKLPTISFPKFGSKAKKESVDMSGVDVQIKAPEISLPQTEVAVSSEPMSLNIKTPDIDKEVKSVTADIKAEDMKIDGQESKFKMPKFGISFPDVKGPKIDLHGSKTTTDISLPEGKGEVHVPDVEMPDVKTEVKLDLPKGETQGVQVEMKKSGFSLPKIGLSKSETKAPDTDVSLPQVDVSLPGQDVKVEGPDANVNLTMGDIGEQDKLKFGSPTKFTLPTISLPKFGSKAKKESVDISGVDVQIKAPEISLPQTEVAVSSEPMSLNIKTPDIDKEIKSLTADIKAEDMKIEGQESKFKMPKFGISFPEVKGPKIDLHGGKTTDISLPEGKGEVHAPDVEGPDVKTEVKLDLPKGETQGVQVEMKKSGFSLPKIGLSKSETKTTEADVSLPQVDASLAEEDVKIEDIKLAMGDTGKEDKPKFGSPTKFKLPTISFPKFGAKVTKEAEDISSVSAHMKGPDITLQQTELKVPADAIAVEIKGPHTDKQGKSLKVKPQDDQFEGQESKFKLPKFAISFPDVKGPKIELPASKTQTDIALPEVKAEVHVSAGEMKDVKSEEKGNLPEVDPKGLEVKAKKTGFSFPWFGFSKAETKAPKADITLPKVDVSLTKENVKIEETNTDVSLSIGDTGQEDKMKFGSPTKFKLPSISLPKFGAKSTKESVDISAAVDEQIQRSEIHLPEVEMSVSAVPLPVDIKVPERDKEGKSLSVETKTQTVEKEKKSKLPKFGISIPEVKGTKIDLHASKTQTDIALPEGKGEVHASDLEIPNIKSEVEVNLPEVDSKDIEIKMKKSGFSFPKFGFSKPETKAPEADVSVPPVDVSLPDENGKMEGSDVALSIDDTRQTDETKFESPTKFKLPSMSFPKFRTKTSKAALDVSAVHVEVPRPEISQPEAELKVSYELLSVDPKGPGVDKEGKSCMEMDIADIKPEINDHIKWKDSKAEAEIKDKVQQSPEAAVKHKEGSPSRFKPLTMKMPIITVSKSQLQDGQDDAVMSGAPEPKHKEITQGQEKSSKFTIPKFADVLRGFDVEFTVPKLDEIEQTKKETPTKQEHVTGVKGEDSKEGVTTNKGGAQEKSMLRFTIPKLRFNHPSDESDNIVNSEAVLENKLSSPTNTAKVNEQEDSQSPRKGHECPEVDIKAKGAEKSSTVEVEEDNVSPTLSLRSSEAFADLSAPTTEQVGLSLASPTKIKVKYSEPTIEVSDLHGDVITSTTSTELIFMEPHQPEKVNIPFSDESSSSSLNTLKQMSGEVHIIKSNVQTVPDTQHATILTYLGSQVIQTLPAEEMTITSDSVLSVETHRVLKEEHTLIEKHVMEEILSDEKVLVTSRTQVFEGGVAEPITDDTASSIQKLKDIVHTEKMRFFEGAESGEKIIMISETSLRHADSSTDENEGK
ncbi:uncharacterized protein LOC143476412 [Brachyhypopomus gauderio]|uniref:uncharacterized protein LOC143476412 n=1 Tax=Brachyhypopomus gauderio TaxID=698409 RepID=UPI004042B8D7